MMFEFASEAAPDAVPMPTLAEANVGHGLICELRDSSHRQYLRYDLMLAMAVQRQMLPRNTKPLTTARFAGTSEAAQGIGGDYYDFLDLAPGSLGFLLADISGKGIAAALLAANLQASIRAECLRGVEDPRAVLERVNEQFFRSTLPEQYATLFFGQYDDRNRRLDYVNCGQQPAILVRRDRSVERLKTTAMPLGMVRSWTGENQTVNLQRGDTLCVCSDGVVEAGVESGREFGEERLISLIDANRDQGIDVAVARIADAARLHEPNGTADDRTLVGIRCV